MRTAAGCFASWTYEDPNTGNNSWLNDQSYTWLSETLTSLYEDMYDWWSLTWYDIGTVGPNRNHGTCWPRDFTHGDWNNIMLNLTNVALYSDLTLTSHGSGAQIGSDYLHDYFGPWDLMRWGMVTGNRNWRLRKACLWTCYSGCSNLVTGRTYNTTWADAVGMRAMGLEEVTRMWKNCGLFFGGEIPQGGFNNDPSISSAQVVESLDEIWVGGKYLYAGGCDPTYSWQFVVGATRGMYNPQLDRGVPLIAGLRHMIYSSVYEEELRDLNLSHVKEQ